MKYSIILATMAAVGAIATIVPSQMGVEVIRSDDGEVMVREVEKKLTKRCTGCVHVGDTCVIGEGNCYSQENAYCTDCGKRGIICVDKKGGSCKAP